jgi:hypothetical protein
MNKEKALKNINYEKDGVKMKFKKFTMSIFLIMTLLISTISSTFALAADTLDYSGAVSRMKHLGILDNAVNNVTVAMTRGQFAKALAIGGNLIDEASSMEGPTVFGDVVSYSKLSGYVNILINKQLMAGMVDGKFHPEASITYSEICTALVRLLGYSDKDLIGTWPSNYLGKAQSLEITDDLDFKKSDKTTIRAAAIMFDRLLGTYVKNDSTNATSNVIFSDSIDSYSAYTIYSKPQLAVGFNPESDKLGDITFDANTKIIKNGQAVTKDQINNMDVVYSVTNINSNYRYILVVENYIEGNITDFITDADSLSGIEIDAQNYDFSSDMDINKLSSFTKGELVSITLDKDNEVVDVRSIENKEGNIAEYIILGNAKTADDLGYNEILTDKGTLTYKNGVDPLEIGTKYQLYVSENLITKINKKENSTENYVVTEKTGINMKWQNDKDEVNSMTLPNSTVYYYHGEKVNYNAAVAAINAFSSMILSKGSSNDEYEYVVIIDPCFSIPKVLRSGDIDFWSEIQNSKYSYVYRNEMYTMNPFSINNYDVVYFVSDIWGKNSYIYANDETVYGYIESFAPSKVNASSVTINKQTYEFSQYFDMTKLNSYYSGNFIKLIIGVDGKVVDIY